MTRLPRSAWACQDALCGLIQVDGDALTSMVGGWISCRRIDNGDWIVRRICDLTGPARELAEALLAERKGRKKGR